MDGPVRNFDDLDEQGWIDAIGHYLGMVSLIDDQVGAIMAYLSETGQLEQTIVVFTSDHGDMMGAHRLMEKGHLLHYEESVHIPLILRHPQALGGRDDQLLSMVDLAPTLAELAGVEVRIGSRPTQHCNRRNASPYQDQLSTARSPQLRATTSPRSRSHCRQTARRERLLA